MSDVLNKEILDELIHTVGGGDPSVLHEVAAMFIELGPEKMREIREGLESGDVETIAGATHSLKGCCGTLGVHRLQADCRDIENELRLAADEDRLRSSIAAAETHLSEGIAALEALIRGSSPRF